MFSFVGMTMNLLNKIICYFKDHSTKTQKELVERHGYNGSFNLESRYRLCSRCDKKLALMVTNWKYNGKVIFSQAYECPKYKIL